MALPVTGEPPGWAKEVIDFWFGRLTHQDRFSGGTPVDDAVRGQFLGLYENLRRVPPTVGFSSERLLASILVFDQFPRNMFRGTPRAFATDPVALDLARGAVRDGLDLQLPDQQRLFVYLPFEHSEDADDQARAVSLIGKVNDPEWTRFAEAHKVIIDRFGRFPHRNAVLGRVSTPEEIEFLKQPGSSF